jgi:hypothetical protein
MRYGLAVRRRSKLPYPPLVLVGGPSTAQKPRGSDTRSYLASYGRYTAKRSERSSDATPRSVRPAR